MARPLCCTANWPVCHRRTVPGVRPGRDVTGGGVRRRCGAPICRFLRRIFCFFSRRVSNVQKICRLHWDTADSRWQRARHRRLERETRHVAVGTCRHRTTSASFPPAQRTPGTWERGIGVDCLALPRLPGSPGQAGVWGQGSGGAPPLKLDSLSRDSETPQTRP